MRHANIGLFVPHAGCPHTCSFCNQRSISGQNKPLTAKDVVDAAETAIKNGCDYKNSEIAFFGGSFTAIERSYMIELLEAAHPYIRDKKIGGIRISTRPDAINDDILLTLKKYGVTSIELGAQSMSDRVLELNERGHTANDVRKASELIKSYGFELGLQMMTGLYGDDDKTAIYTAEELIKLKPKTVRIYPTVVLKGTKLSELYEKNEYKPQTLDEAVALCAKLLTMFESNDIAVIRLGLHSGGDVKENYVAGAFHDAFRELCESEIYFQKIIDVIEKDDISKGDITVYVHPSEISKATGQKHKNINKLKDCGYIVKIKPSNEIEKGKIELEY